VEYAEQLSLPLFGQQINEGSTFDPSTHNHKLFEAKQYYDMISQGHQGHREVRGNLHALLSCEPHWLHLC
jgi:hypothetical protein